MSRNYMKSEKEIRIENARVESVEEFLARGGSVKKVDEGASRYKKSNKNKIDAQKLLDAAIGTEHEAEVIKFLASQGIGVQ